MIPVSPLWRTAIRHSWSVSTRVDIVRAGVVVQAGVPVESGSYTADRNSKTRLSLDVDLVERDGEPLDIDVESCRLRLRSGITSLGYAEWITLGEFRVDEIDRTTGGVISVSASGKEAYVIDDRFVRPRTPPYGTSTAREIKALIQESLPGQRVVFRTTKDTRITATAPWDKERWDAIDSLGVSFGAEVFCDHSGDFIVAAIPSLTTGAPVLQISEGADGILIDRSSKHTRDQVYNAMAVYGVSSDPATPPVFGFAYDGNPNSPTYWRGPFGKVVKYYSSTWFTKDSQCVVVAKQMLVDAMAANVSMSFTAAPVPFLEVGDKVQVLGEDGNLHVHLITKLKWALGGGNLTAETLSTKAAARGDF